MRNTRRVTSGAKRERCAVLNCRRCRNNGRTVFATESTKRRRSTKRGVQGVRRTRACGHHRSIEQSGSPGHRSEQSTRYRQRLEGRLQASCDHTVGDRITSRASPGRPQVATAGAPHRTGQEGINTVSMAGGRLLAGGSCCRSVSGRRKGLPSLAAVMTVSDITSRQARRSSRDGGRPPKTAKMIGSCDAIGADRVTIKSSRGPGKDDHPQSAKLSASRASR